MFPFVLVFILFYFLAQSDATLLPDTDTDPRVLAQYKSTVPKLPNKIYGLASLGESRGSKYWLSTFPTNMYIAESYCMDTNRGSLVSIETDTEQRDIERFIGAVGNRSGVFWTSGTDSRKEGNFVWATGDPILYQHYLENVENSDQKNCIAMIGENSFKWDIMACSEDYLFICESTVCDCRQ